MNLSEVQGCGQLKGAHAWLSLVGDLFLQPGDKDNEGLSGGDGFIWLRRESVGLAGFKEGIKWQRHKVVVKETSDNLGAAKKGLFCPEDVMRGGSRHGPLPGGFGTIVILGPMQVESKPDGLCGGERSVRLLYSLGGDVKEGCGLEPVLGQAHWWIGGAIWEDGAKVATSKAPVSEDRSNEQPRPVAG